MKTKISCDKHRYSDDLKIEQEWMDEWNNSINYTVAPCPECQEEYKNNLNRFITHLEKIVNALNNKVITSNDIEFMDGDFPIEEVLEKINSMIEYIDGSGR